MRDYDGTEITYKEFFVIRTKAYFSPLTNLIKYIKNKFKN